MDLISLVYHYIVQFNIKVEVSFLVHLLNTLNELNTDLNNVLLGKLYLLITNQILKTVLNVLVNDELGVLSGPNFLANFNVRDGPIVL